MEQIQERILSGEIRNLPFGPYEWRVSKVEKGRALLITEYVVEERPYHNPWETVTWETCTLRKYLNAEFFEAFSAEEQAMILKSDIKNPDNEEFGTPGGCVTKDKVFLISLQEADEYFVDDDDRSACDEKKGTHYWWLRSPGRDSSIASGVFQSGSVDNFGAYVTDDCGVRPALWLDLSSDKKG